MEGTQKLHPSINLTIVASVIITRAKSAMYTLQYIESITLPLMDIVVHCYSAVFVHYVWLRGVVAQRRTVDTRRFRSTKF